MKKFAFYTLSFLFVGVMVLFANTMVGHGDAVQLDSELANNVNELYDKLTNEDASELANQVVAMAIDYNEEIKSSNIHESFNEWKNLSIRLSSEGSNEELIDLFEKKTKSIYHEVNG